LRQVKFKQIGMENFRCYIDPVVINFEDNKLVLITGPNGSGKTTIFECFPFTLYGITSKNEKGDDVVNNIVDKNCHTWVTFEIFDNELNSSQEYRVDRYQKYDKIGNLATLRINDEEPYKKGHKEVVPEVERLLVSRKVFMNTLFFSQKVKDFFTDLDDTSRKEIFRKILLLDRYVLYYREVSKRIENILQTLSEIDKKISVNIELLKDSEIQIQKIEESKKKFYIQKELYIKDIQKNIIILNNNKDEMLQKLNKLNSDILSVREVDSKISKTNFEIDKINTDFDNIKQEILSAKSVKESELKSLAFKQKEDLRTSFSEHEIKIKEDFEKGKNLQENQIETIIEEAKEIQSIIAKKEIDLQGKIRDQEKVVNAINNEASKCPLCLQDITEDHKIHLKKEIEDLDNQVKEIEIYINPYKSKLDNLNDKLKEKSEIVKQIKNDFETEIKHLSNQLSIKIKEIDEKLSKVLIQLENSAKEKQDNSIKDLLNKKLNLEKEIQNLKIEKNKKDCIEREIEDINKQINNITIQIEMNKASLESKQLETFDESNLHYYKNKIDEINNENKKFERSKKEKEYELKILEFWKIAFSSTGIPSLLIDESIPFMNDRVSYYLDQISNGRYIVSFDTLQTTKSGEVRDKISINVFDNQTKSNTRNMLSGGQTRVVDIATILMLSDLQSNFQHIKFNLLLMDEIFDSLDEENILYVSRLLKKIVLDKSIFIISHMHIDQIECDEMLSLFS